LDPSERSDALLASVELLFPAAFGFAGCERLDFAMIPCDRIGQW
jgi:hypothetical protein